MKNSFRYILLGLLLSLGACEDEEKSPFDQVTGNLGTAGGLRTINLVSPSLNILDLDNSSFQVEVEEWDDQDGDLLESVDVFVSFQDNSPGNGDSSAPPDNGDPNVPNDLLVSTISASAFAIDGTSGLPRATISVTGSETIAALGLVQSDLDGGDIFRFRLALNLSDGTVFSSNNLEGNVTGSFFNSPFSYPLTLVCVLDTPISGDWNIEGQDSYGDGWNNAAVRVTIDGTVTDYTFTSGNTASFVVNVPGGSETLDWEFVSGSFDSEVTFQIFAPSGNQVANVGPGPTAGAIALNLCNE